MADLLARFRLIDEMSEKFEKIANAGQGIIDRWESAGGSVSETLSKIESAADGVVSATGGAEAGIAGLQTAAGGAQDTITGLVDSCGQYADSVGEIADRNADAADSLGQAADIAEGAAASLDAIRSSGENAANAVEILGDSYDRYAGAAENAADSTGHWTDAVGSYNKEALEWIYSVEDLVNAGYKSADALKEQQEMLEICEQAYGQLEMSIDATSAAEKELQNAIEASSKTSQDLMESDNVSAEAKAELAARSTEAEEAMRALMAAQSEAEAAQSAYNEVVGQGNASLEELEAAAERAAHAGEALAEANGNATAAAENLTKATDNAAEEADHARSTGLGAIEDIASALAAAGITAMVMEQAKAVYELTDAYSEAEKIIVNATGASGEALENLGRSTMEAYAAAEVGSLEDTAAAVGEINTRLGYTDDVLTDTTGLFLDFANATGGNAAKSVRSVTQLMNQWEVGAEDMGLTLDKLTYAGQASGISVDSLSSQLINNKAILDQLDFSLDESIALFMQFEKQGTNVSQVMMGLRSALAKGDVGSADELYEVFDSIASGAMSATEASEMFGSRAGPAIVNAVKGGVFQIDSLVASLESAEGTLQSTAEASQTMAEKWEQADHKIEAAFTSAVEPTISKMSNGLADLKAGFGDFLNEHPNVTKALTAMGVGFGAVTVGIAGTAVAASGAIKPLLGFAGAINTALGPIGWVTIAVTGLVAAGAALAVMMGNTQDETLEMTATTREQYFELQRLNTEYEEACEKYGEASDEALALRYQVDQLNETYEVSAQTMDEFLDKCDQAAKSHEDLFNSIEEGDRATQENELHNAALIKRLEELAGQTEITAVSQAEMEAIISSLNENIDGLNLSYESLIGNQEAAISSLKAYAEAQARQEKFEQQYKDYVALLKDEADQQEILNDAIKNTEAAQKQVNAAQEKAAALAAGGARNASTSKEATELATYSKQLREFTEEQDNAQARLDETRRKMQELEDEWGNMFEAQEEAAEASVTYEEAVTSAVDSVSDKLKDLCDAYDEAYESARNSIDSTIGLFDTMSLKCDISTDQMIDALHNQEAFILQYEDNINHAAFHGLDEGLLTKLSDGSEESAQQLDAIIRKIDELGGDTEEAQAFIDELNSSFKAVEGAKDTFATTVAEMETDFSERLDAIGEDIWGEDGLISKMNMSDEAKEQALETLDAYIEGIRDRKSDAILAAAEVAAAMADALGIQPTPAVTASTDSSTYTVPMANPEAVTSVPRHAEGTTDAEDAFIAGDEGPELIAKTVDNFADEGDKNFYLAGANGPELIVGQKGSTVFPASETERIIENLAPEPVAEKEPAAIEAPIIAAETPEPEPTETYSPEEPTALVEEPKLLPVPAPAQALALAPAPVYEPAPAEPEAIITPAPAAAEPVEPVESIANPEPSAALMVPEPSEDFATAEPIAPEEPEAVHFPEEPEPDTLIPEEKAPTIYNEPTFEINPPAESSENIVAPEEQTKDSGVFVEPPRDMHIINDNRQETTENRNSSSESVKKIQLEINGSGAISLDRGVDEDSVISILTEQLKPVLMSILQSEMYEEGDGSYDY